MKINGSDAVAARFLLLPLLPLRVWHLPCQIMQHVVAAGCVAALWPLLLFPSISTLPLGSLFKNINSQGSSKVAGAMGVACVECGMWRHVAWLLFSALLCSE